MPCQREDVKTLTLSVQEAKLNLNWRKVDRQLGLHWFIVSVCARSVLYNEI